MLLVYASASLHLYLQQNLLHLRWRTGVSSEGFARGVAAAVTLTQVHGLQGWLTLNHHVYPLAPAEQLCLQEQALLPLHQSSLQRVAIVLPAVAFQGAAHESLVASSQPLVSYQMEYFPKLQEACNWLQARPSTTL